MGYLLARAVENHPKKLSVAPLQVLQDKGLLMKSHWLR